MRITKVERQKKNKARFSVFVDDAYAFSVSDEVYARFFIHEDQDLTAEQREAIEAAEAESTVKKTALRFRSYRPRSAQEIVQYLQKKGYDERNVTAAVRYLRENGLLNDTEFARMLCRDRLMLKPVGQSVMRQVLLKKGIEKNTIDSVLSEYYSMESESALALKEGLRKHKRISALPALAQKKRLYEHLVRRGYSSSISMKIVNQLVRQ